MSDSEQKCPSCGFERLETDRHCLMCGYNFLIHDAEVRERSSKSGSAQNPASDGTGALEGSVKPSEPKPVEPVAGTLDQSGCEAADKTPMTEDLPINDQACPSCGFVRHPGDVQCLMCGIDFRIHAATQKKEAERELSDDGKQKEPAIFVDISGLEQDYSGGEQFVMEFEETEKVIGHCRRCGARRIFGDNECRGCGVVFSKIESSAPNQENEEEPEEYKDPFLKKIIDYSSDFFSFAVSLAKGIASVISGIALALFGIAREKGPVAANSLWRVRKPFIYAISLFLVIITGYYSSVFAIKKYSAYKRHAEAVEAERIKNEIAVRFRANALSIRDSILKTAETKGVEEALSALSEYEMPDLRFNPVMIMIKDGLDEMSINEKLRSVQDDDYEAKFNAYSRLTEIAPSNDIYVELLDAYRHLWAEDLANQASSIIRNYNKERAVLEKGIMLAEKAVELVRSEANESVLFRARSERLLFYEGNENILMALRDDGFSGRTHSNQRKIRVWIRNNGTASMWINPDFFSMICEDGERYPYNDFSKNLVVELRPGEEVEGDVFFYTRLRPRRFIFDHSSKGQIYRDMP